MIVPRRRDAKRYQDDELQGVPGLVGIDAIDEPAHRPFDSVPSPD